MIQNPQLVLQVTLLDGTTHTAKFSWRKKGKDLRRFIYQHLSDELEDSMMSVYWGNKRISAKTKLKALGASKGEPLRIIQKKLPICNIDGVKAYMEETDALTGQKGVVRMSCKHKLGRGHLIQIAKTALNNKKTHVICPLAIGCQRWEWGQIDKIAVFTKSEKNAIVTMLKTNRSRIKELQAKLQAYKLPETTKSTPIPRKLPPPNPNIIKIKIKPFSGQETEIMISKMTTGQQLKQYIYSNISDSLQPQSMSLYYEGVKIGKTVKLSQLNIVVGTQLKITQHKADISQIANIIADVHGIDQISLEQGVARMSCGHNIGRDTMTSLVRSLISSNRFQIRCPYPDENQLMCNAAWCFKDCKKIGVFTKEQAEEFEKGLSLNWMKEFTKKCPKCKETICKLGLKTNRVICPFCKYGDFCYLCLNPWRQNSQMYCGNEECKFLEDFLSNAPWTRSFQLYDKSDGNQLKRYMTPKFRACPVCSLVIEHHEACKHMTCKSCSSKFCWVCLRVWKGGNWQCGSYNEYCGKVAQTQKLTGF